MKTNSKPIPGSSLLCLLVLIAFAAGCASHPTIQYEADRSTAFSAYKTYALFPMDKSTGISGADPNVSLRYAPVINTAVADGLKAKGYTPADITAANFSVRVNATIAPKIDIDTWGYTTVGYPRWGDYWGQPGLGYPGYPVTTVDSYDEGLLRIEIYDNTSKELVWVGWAKDRLGKSPSDEAVADVIAQVLANSPPPPATP